MEKIGIYKKITTARKMLNGKELKMSGHNKFANFKYFELKDFLPSLVEIFENIGICSQFCLEEDQAILTLIDIEDGSQLNYTTIIAEDHSNIKNPIQKLGATHTYLKRYLYLNALEISENDVINSLDNTEIKKVDEQNKKNKVKNKDKIAQQKFKKMCEENELDFANICKINNITANTTETELNAITLKIIGGMNNE